MNEEETTQNPSKPTNTGSGSEQNAGKNPGGSSKNAPVDLEGATTGSANIGKGREVTEEPTQEELRAEQADRQNKFTSNIPGMEEKLKYVPNEIRDRVAKLRQEDIAMGGMPHDREAYAAYLQAEKTIRDERRKKEKQDMSFDGVHAIDE